MALEGLEYEPAPKQREVCETLARTQPAKLQNWVQRHPAHLMMYLGWDVDTHHAQALKDVISHRQTFWLAPRGSGKSTTFLLHCAWMAIADPEVYTKWGIPYLFPGSPGTVGPHNIRINVTSNSADNATALVWQAKQSLLDHRMAALFGDLEGKRWRDQRADTALRTETLRETTFTAMGLGSRITGGHYDVVLSDDWVTEENARTELWRQRLVKFWQFTVKPTHEPWSRDLGTGTRYHPFDWYGTEVMKWVKRGTWGNLRRTLALWEKDGELTSYWPRVYSVDKLLEIKEDIGEIAFDTQYQNSVDTLRGDFFEQSWMENLARWEELSPEDRKQARTVIALDPAIKAGPRNDYSVFCVVSFLKGKLYVRRIVRGQWTDEQLKVRTKVLVKLYQPELVGVEVVGGIEWLADALARMDLPGCRVKKLRPTQYRGKDKVGRASHVRKYLEQGIVYLEEPTKENGVGRLIYEMMAFPSASNVPGMDDCVDAFVWALILVSRGGGRGRVYRLESRRHI